MSNSFITCKLLFLTSTKLLKIPMHFINNIGMSNLTL